MCGSKNTFLGEITQKLKQPRWPRALHYRHKYNLMIQFTQTIAQKLFFSVAWKVAPDRFLRPVHNFFDRPNTLGRRALLVYKTIPFRLKRNHAFFRYHQNMSQSLLIAQVLDQLGFVVDVVDYTRSFSAPSERYNVVISHDCTLDPTAEQWRDAKRIYLASGTEHILHNERQQQRLEAFVKRRGNYDIELYWDEKEMRWTEAAHAIFCFGNESIADTWRNRFQCPVFPFANTALPGLECPVRDWVLARKHFLFLGSRQQLAKGLDVLLEAFDASPDLHLHVCGHYLTDRAFCHVYYNQLFCRPNIHSHGWVDLASRKARRLAQHCGFTITATCAEGSPGSLTNAMRCGLIPLLSDYAGIDPEPDAPSLGKASVYEITQGIVAASNYDSKRLKKLSCSVVTRAKENFSEESFVSAWIRMLTYTLFAR